MANSLGSGVLEARAMLAFIPHLAEKLLGQPLKLPNVATWWCGDAEAREYVRGQASRMLLSPAQSRLLPFDPDDDIVYGAHLTETLDQKLTTEGASLVGQEIASLSTSPALIDDKLVPRPMSLRMYLCRTDRGWQVMPGGYARIGRTEDVSAISMKRGGSVADVWVVSDHPVPTDTIAMPATARYPRPQSGTLPSRAADNLFWLGRYVERAEHMVRMLRAQNLRLAEVGEREGPLSDSIAAYMTELPLDPTHPLPEELLGTLKFRRIERKPGP